MWDEVGFGNDLGHQPGRDEPLGREDAPGQQEQVGEVAAQFRDAPLGPAAARHEAELDFGQTHSGVVGGDHDVAAQNDLEAAAERETVDGGDHRLGVAFDRLVHLRTCLLKGGEFGLGLCGVFLDVGAGHEGAPVPGENDDADRRVVREQAEGVCDLSHHPAVHRIELIAAQKRHFRHAADPLD